MGIFDLLKTYPNKFKEPFTYLILFAGIGLGFWFRTIMTADTIENLNTQKELISNANIKKSLLANETITKHSIKTDTALPIKKTNVIPDNKQNDKKLGDNKLKQKNIISNHGSGDIVVSQYQSGGQTAKSIYNYNERPTARTIKDHRDQIIQELKKVEPIDYQIEVLTGDWEAINLATEIKSAFDSAGWNKGSEIRRGIGGTYPPGFAVAYDKPTKQSEIITVALVNAGLYGGIYPDFKQEKLKIFIGPNPDTYTGSKPELQWVPRQFK